jgi:hypothetical protein
MKKKKSNVIQFPPREIVIRIPAVRGGLYMEDLKEGEARDLIFSFCSDVLEAMADNIIHKLEDHYQDHKGGDVFALLGNSMKECIEGALEAMSCPECKAGRGHKH